MVCAFNADEEIGKIIAEAIDKVGEAGVIDPAKVTLGASRAALRLRSPLASGWP